VKETERTTCTKVGMTFSELDVSLKVSHDECFRVKFEQDYKLMNFLSIYPEVGRKLSKLSCEAYASVDEFFQLKFPMKIAILFPSFKKLVKCKWFTFAGKVC